jgi:hypothetical protein
MSKSRRPSRLSRALLVLEMLEDRIVPSTLTVTTNADSGAGSLPPFSASSSAASFLTVANTPSAGGLPGPLSLVLPVVNRVLSDQASQALDGLSSPFASAVALTETVSRNQVQDASAHGGLFQEELHLAYDLSLFINQPQTFSSGGLATWALTADIVQASDDLLKDPLFGFSAGRQEGERDLAFDLSELIHNGPAQSAAVAALQQAL